MQKTAQQFLVLHVMYEMYNEPCVPQACNNGTEKIIEQDVVE